MTTANTTPGTAPAVSPAPVTASSPPTATTPSPPPVAASSIYTQNPDTLFTDDSSQAVLEVGLKPSSRDYGSLRITAQGVGTVWPLHTPSVVRSSAHSATVTHDGRGFVNRRVKLNEFNLFGALQGPVHFAHIRVEAHLDPPRRTGVLDLWVRHKHTHLVFAAPARDAGPAVRAVIKALANNDIAAIYDLADQSFRGGRSRAQFVAELTAHEGNDSVDAVRRTGPVSYVTTVTGVRYAAVPAIVTMTQRGVRRHARMEIVLIREAGQWRFSTTRDAQR